MDESLSRTAAAESDDFRVLLYYRYFRLDDPASFLNVHRALCERLGLRGRILIGTEGLNGTVSGPAEATDRYLGVLATDRRTAGMPVKIDRCAGHVFPKLTIKLRSEIVRLGLDPADDIDPNVLSGRHLQPAEWAAALEDPRALVIDGRNRYESDLGHFRGAVCPDIENFRDFPDWLRAHADELRGRKILTYCTGGIRCEKLSGYLLREGFDEVYQLEGGIIRYGQDPATRGRWFDGLCYVFDQRVAVEVNHTDTRRLVSQCRHCGEPSARYRNCGLQTCHSLLFICEACEATEGSYCGESCRAHHEAVQEPAPV